MATVDVLPEGFQDVRLAVAIIEKDIIQNTKVVDKLSEAVEKIQEMNQNLCKMIALHELRHDSSEKAQESFNGDLREVHSRIDKFMEKPKTTKGTKQDELDLALAELKKWKYIITGAAIVIGYLLAHINWAVLLSLLSFHGQ
jgi:hypothetical protein